MQSSECDPPPYSVTLLEKLVYDMGSQETRYTGDLCVDQVRCCLEVPKDTHKNKWLRHFLE